VIVYIIIINKYLKMKKNIFLMPKILSRKIPPKYDPVGCMCGDSSPN